MDLESLLAAGKLFAYDALILSQIFTFIKRGKNKMKSEIDKNFDVSLQGTWFYGIMHNGFSPYAGSYGKERKFQRSSLVRFARQTSCSVYVMTFVCWKMKFWQFFCSKKIKDNLNFCDLYIFVYSNFPTTQKIKRQNIQFLWKVGFVYCSSLMF